MPEPLAPVGKSQASASRGRGCERPDHAAPAALWAWASAAESSKASS